LVGWGLSWKCACACGVNHRHTHGRISESPPPPMRGGMRDACCGAASGNSFVYYAGQEEPALDRCIGLWTKDK
jgi:hypothetical protein